MNLLAQIESLAFSAAAITTDAAAAHYGGSKAARARVKRDIRALSKRYKALYLELIAEEKDITNGSNRAREIPKVPFITSGDKAQKQTKPSPKKSRKGMGEEGD